MSYLTSNRNPHASRRNGIMGQTQRYLDTLGRWSTYQDIASVEALPARIAEVTTAYFGLKGLTEGQIRLSGLLSAVILVHALEQATAGLATSGMRLYARGRPVASYRGILIRESPFTLKATQVLGQVTGGRLLVTQGYYFFESGKTWHCHSLAFQFGDETRTLTLLQSFSIPQREFSFDRPVVVPAEQEPAGGERVISIQRLINVVKGDEPPEAIPGFIGSVNELESLTILRSAKYLLFMVHWLLIDPAERDNDSRYIDYEALAGKGTASGGPGTGSGGLYQVIRPSGGSSPGGGWWPSTSRMTSAAPASTPPPPPPPPPPYEADLFGAAPAAGPPSNGQAGPAAPVTRYKDRIRIDGRDYPLVVKRVLTSPINGGRRKVDAIYYDDILGQWREVVDEEDRVNLARAVEIGLVAVIDPANWPAV